MNTTLIQKVNVISESGAANKIGELIKECGYTNPLIVCDKGLIDMDFIQDIVKSVKESGLSYSIFSDVYPNPEDDLVDKGLDVVNKNKCDSILAIGGGSSIDTAKCINIMRFNEGSILDYENKAPNDCKGFFSIPTTAGTGSELSQGAIISNHINHQKKLIFTDCFKEEYTILDPLLTLNLPKRQTVYTGLDVFSHAAESYTASKASPIVDLICEKVMETVVEYLPIAVKDGHNEKARERMLNAASLGGWVLMCSSDHLGHAIAHIIGARYNLIHGQACMYGFESMLRFINDTVPEKVRNIGLILKADIRDEDDTDTILEKTIGAYHSFTSLIGADDKNISYNDEDIKGMAEELVSNPFLDMCPKKISYDDALKIMEGAVK